MRKTILLVLCMLACSISFAQQGTDDRDTDADKEARQKQPAAKKPVSHFPFIVDDANEEYDLSIDLGNAAVADKYGPAFKKHDLSFDPDTFEELVQMIIREKNASMSQIVLTATEEKKVLIGSGNKIYQQNVMTLLKGVLNNAKELDEFLSRMAKGE